MKKSKLAQLFLLLLLSVGIYALIKLGMPTHGLVGTYFANPRWEDPPHFTHLDPEISDQILRTHRPSLPHNRFSIHWQGFLVIEHSGLYTFATRSDDGSWLYVDGQLVVDNGGSHGLQEVRGEVELQAGVHEIEVRYFQGGGAYRMEVLWSQGEGLLQRIPCRVLYPFPISYGYYQVEKVLGGILFIVPVIWVGILSYLGVYWMGLCRLRLLGVTVRTRYVASVVGFLNTPWGAIGFLALLVVIFFYDIVFLGKTLLTTNIAPGTTPYGAYNYWGRRASNFHVMDPFASAWIHEPITHLTSRLYHQGLIPLWNPHAALGTPLNADMISTVFFPLSFLLYLTPQPAMWDFYLLLRVFLAGVLMYLFLKQIQQLDQISAILGSVAYMFCGHIILHINIVFIHAAMLLPALMYTTEKLYREPGVKWGGFQGVVVGLLILGGHPEPSFFALLFATGYYLMRCLVSRGGALSSIPPHPQTPFLRIFFKRLVALIGSYGLGLMISAIMVLPFLEFVQHAYLGRHDPDLVKVGLWYLPVKDMILLALPYFFGPIHQSWDGVIWDYQPGYVGMGVIWLVVLATLEGLSFRKTYLFFTLTLVFFLVQGYGLVRPFTDFIGQLPIFEVSHFTRYFPPEMVFSAVVLGSAQIHRIRAGKYRIWRLGGVVGMSWILLGILWKEKYREMGGADQVMEGVWQMLPVLVLTGMILLGIGLVARRGLSSGGLVVGIGIGLIGELFMLVPRDHADRYEPFVEAPFIKFLKSDRGSFRVYGLDGYLYPNTASAYELNDVGFVNGLVNKRFWTFSASLINPTLHTQWFLTGGPPVGEIRNVGNRFFNLFNLKYVMVDRQGAPPYFHAETRVQYYTAGAILTNPLLPEVSVGQSFTSNGDLYGIGLFFYNYRRSNTGRILFKLKESPLSETSLYTTWIDMATIRDTLDYTVSFPPLQGSKGKTFYFELTAPEATRENTVALWSNLRDIYPGGQLYLNGQPVSGDLGFKVYTLAPQASFELVYDGEVKVYRNNNALPRAFIVHQAEVIAQQEKVLERLKDESFDVRHQIILEKEPQDQIILNSGVSDSMTLDPELQTLNSAEVVRYEPTQVVVKAKLGAPGFLVLGDAYYPGWKAYVNPSPGLEPALSLVKGGVPKELEILLTDYCLRSVFLNSGEYEVVFKYEPTSYKMGAWLTLTGLSVLTATLSNRGVLGVRKV